MSKKENKEEKDTVLAEDAEKVAEDAAKEKVDEAKGTAADEGADKKAPDAKDAAAKALHEASQMVVDFVRQMSWHDAKNPPIAHEESWECAGEKHCAVISDIVWVCCESGHTMKGWVENGTWHIEDGHRAEDGHYGHVKLWAPLLEPPEVKK